MVLIYVVAQLLVYTLVNAIPCKHAVHNLTNFQPADFAGTWYTVAQLKNPNSVPAKCVKINVAVNSDGIEQHVTEIDSATSSPNAYDWNLLFLGEPKYAFYQDPPASDNPKCYYQTLAIDTAKYEVCLGCDSEKDQFYVWINLRQPSLTNALKNEVFQILNDNNFGLTENDFDFIDQTGCSKKRNMKKLRHRNTKRILN